MSDVEMTNEKNNQEEDKKIQQSRVWEGRAMNGTWDGNGMWHKDNHQWTGNGTWRGGLISGTWNVKGDWEPIDDGIGEWKGYGRMESNTTFAKFTERLIAVIGFVAVAVIGFISNGLVAGLFGWITIIIVIIGVLSIVIILRAQSTNKGKLWLKGTWKDDGEFRILDMHGKWKLGIHEGIIRGKMKDPKPQQRRNERDQIGLIRAI